MANQGPSNLFRGYTIQGYNITYPALLKLFEFRQSTDKINKDARCLGCGQKYEKFKIDRIINHARICNNLDEGLVLDMEDQVKRKSAAKLIQGGDHAAHQERLDQLVVNFICESASSISIVENREFITILKMAVPNYIAPTRYKLSNISIPAAAKEVRKFSKNKLEKAPKYSVTVKFDAWTSSAGASLLAVIATLRDGLSILLDLIDISAEPHTGEYLAYVAMASLRTNLQIDNINAIISDEASNFRLARSLMIEELDNHVVEYRCIAHVFNLIGALMSKSEGLKSSLDDLVKLVNYVSKHKVLVSYLKDEGATKVVRSVPTRWYSTCATINSILKLRPFLQGVPRESAYGYEKWGPIVESRWFWKDLEDAKIYFDRLASMIGVAEASDSLLSDSFRALLEYGRFIFVELDSTARFRDTAAISFLTHSRKLDLELMATAYLFNPNFSLEYLTPEAVSKCKRFAVRMLLDMGFDDESAALLISEFNKYFSAAKRASTFIQDI